MIRRFAPVLLAAAAVSGAVLAQDAQIQPQGHAQGAVPVTLASLPTVLDRSALDHATVYVSAGRRGLELALAPRDLARLTEAVVAGCDSKFRAAGTYRRWVSSTGAGC